MAAQGSFAPELAAASERAGMISSTMVVYIKKNSVASATHYPGFNEARSPGFPVRGSWNRVGPRVCDNPNVQDAFNEFHNNLHIVTAAGIGPAAPGLHNFTGAELFAGPC